MKRYVKGKWKQCGFQHLVTSKTDSYQVEILVSMDIEVSQNDSNVILWSKFQFVVILSQTKLAKDMIFFVNRLNKISAFKIIMVKKSK